ncbi:ATP-binding cassette sub-family A member 3 like protein [Argiope bruennichi]|nr:ATP-binding cassette sub-family A member 3 like protein [Argiope bruennichi]
MAKLRQFLLLIWKNFKLQWRHPWITLLELGVPAIFSLCLVLVRSFISSNYVTDPTLYEPFNINGLPANLTPSSGQWEIIYAPESVFLDKIVNNAASKLNVLYRGFNDEDSMLAFVTNTTNDILSGIVFDHTLEDGPYNSTNIKYKIRPGKPESGNTVFQNTIPKWQTQYTFPIFPALGPRNRFLGWGGSPGYMSKGFLSIQHALATSFMEIFANESDKKLDVDIEMCRYPYPPFLDDNFILSLQSFFPMIICFSFIYPAVNIVKNIVVEKEKKLKESMKMMGLSKWLHWIAWFIKYFLFLILSCSVMTVLLCVKFTKDLAVINATDPSVILIWLIVYTASIICFCFFLSTLFSKANSATSFAGIIFFLTFTPYFFIMPRYNTMSRAAKMLCCLVPNLAIAMGSIILAFSEASGLFKRSYWCGQNQNLSDMVEFYNSEIKQSEYFEKDPVDLMAGIQVHGLTKVYGKRNSPAVNNISINMYRSHITVLLGHNGAGKTTTISMLTGLITPTSGTAMVNGYDICEEMDSVHSNLGICPQHDVLFDELTVEEHLNMINLEHDCLKKYMKSTEIDLQSVDYQNEERNTGLQLFLQHLEALLKKRILHTVRNWTLTIPQLILPPFFLIITLVMLKTLPKPEDAPPLLLSIDSFHGSLVPYDVNMNFNETRALGNFFSSQFTGLNKPYQINSTKQNLTSYLLEVAAEDLGRYNLHNMVAAKFDFNGPKNKTLITTLFNNQAYHSPAIALLEVHNAILKFLSNNAYSFKVINHPLPRSLEDKGQEQQTDMTESYQIAQDIMFGMSFLVASFAVFIIKERASGSKHLQRVSGGNLFSYWFASFLWDLLNYLIPCCLVLVVFIAFGTEGFSSAAGQGRLFVVFLVHGLSILPFVYCCTFLFMSPSTAYVRICLFNILAGIATLLTVTILEIPGIGVKSVAKILDFIFSILIPNYDLGRAVANLYQNHQFNKFCNNHDVQLICRYHLPLEAFKPCCKDDCGSTCIPWEENYFAIASPGIGKQLIFFAIQAVLFTYILVLCERNFIRYLRYKIKGHKITPTSIPTLSESIEVENIEDDDVRAERLKIQSIALPDLFLCNHLVIREVTKQFGNFTAVNKLSFGVRKGECFGLLGLNGAGKTSTFKMITGDTSITSGEIYVDSFDVKKESRKVQKRIGYCPQFDGLIDQLTGRETLTLFSCLRGIPKHLIADQVNSLSELLSFQIHIDKQVKDYSGGNKRKLSTAIALLGNAPVIFLDEPTTGMDPVSRRCLWNALLQVVQAGRSVVLTTHSMEECEALCSRLVIMVNGRLCCLGSPQHLKSKFGEGFTLVIKIGQRVLGEMNPLKSTVRSGDGSSGHYQSGFVDTMNTLKRDMDDVRAFVDRTFESATLKSAHENLLLYHIPRSHLSWSEIFRLMENAKSMFNIEDYSVGETSLEQVFVNFAMGQR